MIGSSPFSAPPIFTIQSVSQDAAARDRPQQAVDTWRQTATGPRQPLPASMPARSFLRPSSQPWLPGSQSTSQSELSAIMSDFWKWLCHRDPRPPPGRPGRLPTRVAGAHHSATFDEHIDTDLVRSHLAVERFCATAGSRNPTFRTQTSRLLGRVAQVTRPEPGAGLGQAVEPGLTDVGWLSSRRLPQSVRRARSQGSGDGVSHDEPTIMPRSPA